MRIEIYSRIWVIKTTCKYSMLWTHSHTEYARAQCEWSVMRLKKHTIYLSELEKNNSKSWMFGKLYLYFSITITWNNCKYKFIFKINKTKMSLNIHVTAIVHINWKYQMTPPLSLSPQDRCSSTITTQIFRINLQYFIVGILYLSLRTRVIVIADQYVTYVTWKSQFYKKWTLLQTQVLHLSVFSVYRWRCNLSKCQMYSICHYF